jgi:hypothetical protein
MFEGISSKDGGERTWDTAIELEEEEEEDVEIIGDSPVSDAWLLISIFCFILI